MRLLSLLFLSSCLTSALAQVPTGFVQRQVARNLNPTALNFSPDGRLFVLEKDGKIREIINDVLAPDPFLTIPNVDTFNERGLSGLCFHPDYPKTPYFYVYYTVKGKEFNRLSRFRVNGRVADPASETVLVEFDPFYGSIHNAGVMRFGTDKKLYVAVGDGANSGLAQSLFSRLGKVHRFNDDGSIPADNPFVGQVAGPLQSIYAIGFRNPFSMDIDPVSGRILLGDVGGGNFEEINDIRAGRNYGWPLIEGKRTNQTAPANYADPLYTYDHNITCAVTGVAFYNPKTVRFPAEYKGRFFFADYCKGHIRTLDPATGQLIGDFVTGIDRPVGIVTSPDGYLYYLARAGRGGGSQADNTATTNGSVFKVSYLDSGVPYITNQAEEGFVAVGETVNFEVDAVGQKPFTYRWFRNGQLLTGAIQSKYTIDKPALTDNGAIFRCVVSNAVGADTTAVIPLRVVQGQRPVVRIRQPLTNTTYRAGNEIAYAGDALNTVQQPLANAKLTWSIDFHHEDHVHPALDPTVGPASGIYRVPRTGETATDVFYRIHLRATDVSGLSAQTSVDVKPEVVNVAVFSNPASGRLILDGTPQQPNFSFEAVSGTLRTFEAKPYLATADGVYKFSGWTDGRPATVITYEVPTQNTNIGMTYKAQAATTGNGLWAEYFTNTREFLGTPTLTRIDETVNFNWDKGRPSPQITDDYFLTRWTGKILAPLTDTYTFFTDSDDGVRLWVDNRLLIDEWAAQPPTEWSGKIDLVAGRQYDIRLEYREDFGEAVAKLLWSTPQFDKAIISKSQLYSVKVVTANSIASEPGIVMFPSPARDLVTVRYTATTSGPGELEAVDLLGRTIYKQVVRCATGQNEYMMSVANWPSGLYHVAIKSEGQPMLVRRLLVP
jgi:glucose/arabinose dehydrogenase